MENKITFKYSFIYKIIAIRRQYLNTQCKEEYTTADFEKNAHDENEIHFCCI
jgi:hypothetical protein